MNPTNGTPVIEMEDIHKSFGKIQALRGVDFTVDSRQVVGLLGDNGAGKSTLIKTLIGIHQPDRGEIRFQGEPVHFSSPMDARHRGIETCYQDLALIELLSISRNFFMGRELTRKIGPFRFLRKAKMDEICRQSLQEIGIDVRSVDETVSNLSGGERQSIAIGRAVHFGAELLILDEPTAALSIKEGNKVLDYVREARDRGLSVIFITHNVTQVYPVADKLTILENGENLGDYTPEEVEPEDVMRMIATGQKIHR